ncbi:helix-turn-helix domain-containing protein [Paenibacillus contaminans]|uniref:DNA-binding protein n=1 Tax=Paenibacillus contaminans TaxID=450362 RepID=A0A329MPP8_9BACL|nr:XRE family transcriptional regulator [Paenibacillus contaminans]RAV21899.1 DNA-binding protein [Paenibacillus contaminans]
MELTEPIHKKIGKNLQAIRKTRALSLDQVAELTGVSKAMLGQIERGDSNPTISVLWKIVNGLRISFTSLIENDTAKVLIVRRDDLTPLLEEEGAYRVFPFFPYNQQKHFEIYTVEMDAGCSHTSEAHNEGVEEYILVIEGELDVKFEQESHRVKAGSGIHFTADLPHMYINSAETVTKYYTLIYYPD